METETIINSTEAEDGEILHDDPEDLYIPLERPHIPSSVPKPLISNESDEDNVMKESSSDSDSSTKNLYPSKIRKKLPARAKSSTMKKKNYNIWCTELQTEVLTNCLVGCNVGSSNDRARDVESYNYKLAKHRSKDEKPDNNALNDGNGKNKWHLGKRRHNGGFVKDKMIVSDSEEQNNCKNSIGSTRNILSLSTTVENSESEIAVDIANKLCEEKEDLILRAINITGKETIISLFEETQKIEASGGMLIMNGTRRRTPGGIFFYLIKTSDSIPRDKINLIFLKDKKDAVKEKKRIASDMRKLKVAKYKEVLAEEDFPTLLSRTELAIQEYKTRRLREESGEVSNPPPSPATDG